MSDSQEVTMQAGHVPRGGHWLDDRRVRFYAGVALGLYALFVAAWAWSTHAFTVGTMLRPGADFSVFWSAGHLALQGDALAAYDFERLRPVIAAHGALADGASFDLPWLYPPTFLLLMAPLAALPFALAYVVFVSASGFAYVAALLRMLDGATPVAGSARWLPIVACPGFALAAAMGQNAFLTAALAAWSVLLLPRRPLAAGMLAGVMCIKPQLAVLIPVALVAGAEWKALAAAAATALAMLLVSAGLFGWETVPAFLATGAQAKQAMLERSAAAWYAMPTTLAMARLSGASVQAAYWLQGATALAAAGAVAYVWRRQAGTSLRMAALGAGAALSSPYLWYYDLSWLGLALVALAAHGVGKGWLRGERGLLLATWLLPLYLFINRGVRLPQCGVILLVLVMLAVLRRVRRETVTSAEAGCRRDGGHSRSIG